MESMRSTRERTYGWFHRGRGLGRLSLLTLLAAVCIGVTAPAALAGPLITSFTAGVLKNENVSNPQESDYDTVAGSRPDVAFTKFTFATGLGTPKQLRVDLPAGLTVNPQAIPRCSESELSKCPKDTQVGVNTVTLEVLGSDELYSLPVYNMTPESGHPAEFAFEPIVETLFGFVKIKERVNLLAGIRYYPSNGQPGDYGEYFTISGLNVLAPLISSTLIFWGAPEEHNGGGAPNNAFLTNPTICNGKQTTYISAETYESNTGTSSYETPVGASGCPNIPFNPTVSVNASTTKRDSPDGVTVEVKVPQNQEPSKTATSQLQTAIIAFPEGMTINPAGASALEVCTEGEFGAGTNNAITCPSKSVIGTAEISTPLLGSALTGSIYIGERTGNTYKVFMNAANASAGVSVRLIGSVKANTSTGSLFAIFENAPQIPFSTLKMSFTTGSSALFANPLACGSAETQTGLIPYSGDAAAGPTSTFTVDSNGSGGSCPSTTPFSPTGKGELSTLVAGAHPTFTLNIARSDGEQNLESLSTKLPPGLLANVSSVTQCPESEANAGTCSSASEIGTSTITAGAGESPLSLTGKVYLTKSYGGGSFGLSIVTPAIAGPYNLGTVVVRAAVAVNTSTGQVTITTGKLPSILEGVPLRLKTVKVEISKANFFVNPTSCEANAITGLVASSGGAPEKSFSSATQMTGCNSLAFSPTISATPSTTKHDSPTGLELGLKIPANSADLKGAVVTLPAGMSINPAGAVGLETCSQAHYEAQTCPSGSKVGTAEISTPLISGAMTGFIYIGERTGNTYAIYVEAENSANDLSVHFSGVVAANSTTGQLTATFSNTPPIPLSELKLKFNSGSKALLANALSCASASASGVLTPNSGESAAEPQSPSFTPTNNGASEACPSTTPFSPTGKGELSTLVAGAHPTFTLNIARSDGEQNLESLSTKLPPGLLANVSSVTQCPESEANAGTCSSASEIGTSTITAGAGESPLSLTGKVYLTKSYGGGSFGLSIVTPAIAGPYNLGTVVVRAAVAVNTSTGQVTITTGKLPSILEGVPLRLKTVKVEISKANFFVNPTSCEANAITGLVASSGGAPEKSFSSATQMTGCNSLAFSPTISATPSTTKHDSPTGLELGLKIPANSADLKGAVVTLPAGMSINPAGAVGLETCSQAHYEAQTCPSGSKVGTAEISTPLISGAMTGFIYIGERTGNTYAIYVEAENSANDLSVHFSGVVAANSTTGQLTATFSNTPPIPLSELKLKFNSGSKALLANALSCGAAVVSTSLTPTSGSSAASPESAFTVDANGSGGSCPGTVPFQPSTTATLGDHEAGAHDTLTIDLVRSDGEQTLSALTTKLPVGLLAELSSVTPCSQASAAAGTCATTSPGSEIGTTSITAGAGESPLSLTGKVFLTKAYGEGALGLAIIVPAIAGPYDLGNVIVRAAVDVDTVHGQITIRTDPLPSILDGIPLRLKTVHVAISKPNFLINPTVCDGQSVNSEVTSAEGATRTASTANGIVNCPSLSFSPTISTTPATTQADAPVGLRVDLNLPQPNSSDLKEAVVTLPAGLALNPSVASGLEACRDSELAVGTSTPVTCPSKSQIGTVKIFTPLLTEPLTGGIYVGEPQSGNPYRIFVDAESPEYGLSVRLIGSLHADEHTGQLTATFAEAPQIPFTDVRLEFDGGAHSPLVNPVSCGTATTTSSLTPSSGAVATPGAEYTVGGSCPSSLPFSPTLNTSLHTPAAGAFNDLTLSFATQDDEQRLGAVSATLPPGLVGLLSSVALCGEPAASQGTCSSASAIGSVTVGAGAGESPLELPGTVYLTGPYDGAPFGLSIVVPAIAGPYDLGTVVVQARVNVNAQNGQITVTTGSLPSILQGIPLHIKAVALSIDRSDFLVNPTSCQAASVSGSLTSSTGTEGSVSDGLSVSGCESLPFSPALTAVVGGGRSNAEGTSFAVTVTPHSGQANLKAVTVALPSSLPVRLTTLNQSCPAATFQTNPGACPAVSAVGTATATTPVLPGSLTGTAYLVGHAGASVPTLEVALSGDGVALDLSGTTKFTPALTTTFSSLPDVPLSSFNLTLHGGPASVLTAATTPTCTAAPSMQTTLIGQNGASVTGTKAIEVSGCASSASGAAKVAGDAPARWLKIKVLVRDYLSGNLVRVKLRLPSAGRVTVSGRAIVTGRATTSKGSRTVWVALRLSSYGRRLLGHRKYVKVTIKLSFVERSGRKGFIYKTITLR
jgi:hypothetical protein